MFFPRKYNTAAKIISVSLFFGFLLFISIIVGLISGVADIDIKEFVISFFTQNKFDSSGSTIIWQIRLPRVLIAALTGGALSLGGLVFQALLRNPLAEPYILGISGGSAIGAIIGIMAGFSYFPGISVTAFAGSMATLALVVLISSKEMNIKKDSLILAGVMVNAFCSAFIMFLISVSDSSKFHNILFWLMGDFAMVEIEQIKLAAIVIFPCFIFFFIMSYTMNLILVGKEMAKSMGVNIKRAIISMLIVSSLMVSITVCQAGLLGFVGLVVPHMLRILLGPDHRVLVPASIMGGGAYMVLCDILARTLSHTGEMPVGVITSVIGAPLFIILLKRSNK